MVKGLSLLRLAVKAFEFPINLVILLANRVSIRYRDIFFINGILFVRNQGQIQIGKRVTINSKYSANPIGGQTFTSLCTEPGGKIVIGDGAAISNSAFVAHEKIEIGSQVYIGGSCRIYDTDFHSIWFEERFARPETGALISPVKISNRVFVGTGVTILKGVVIGEGSVVGACSVVTKSIPAGEVWAGNPARSRKKIDSASR